MKQTAVEWLYQHLFPKQLDGFSEEEWSKIDSAFEQAKEMEKQQIIGAYMCGYAEAYLLEEVKKKQNNTTTKPLNNNIMEADKIAKEIYNGIFNSGKSTDYFWSPDFKNMCKEKAINVAERDYKEPLLSKIILEINKL